MPTKESRNARYESATEVQRHLYADERSGTALLAIAQKHNLTEAATYKKFALAVGDIILGFREISETSQVLQSELGLAPEALNLLTVDVLEFLKPLVNEEGVKEETPVIEEAIESEITEVEESIQKLNPIRTMGSDSRQVGYSSNEETTYTSTQSALMNESK